MQFLTDSEPNVKIDVLVKNAGIFPFGSTAEASDEDIDSVYVVNVKAPFIPVASLAPAMAERGKGSIVNVLTMVAHFGMAGMGLYGASKAALMLLTRAWAAELVQPECASTQPAPGQRAQKGLNRWGTSSTSWPRSARRAVLPRQSRLPMRSRSWPAMTRASSTAPCWTLTEAATPV